MRQSERDYNCHSTCECSAATSSKAPAKSPGERGNSSPTWRGIETQQIEALPSTAMHHPKTEKTQLREEPG